MVKDERTFKDEELPSVIAEVSRWPNKLHARMELGRQLAFRVDTASELTNAAVRGVRALGPTEKNQVALLLAESREIERAIERIDAEECAACSGRESNPGAHRPNLDGGYSPELKYLPGL